METHDRVLEIWGALIRGGEAAIDHLIIERASEDQWLDFKRAKPVNAGEWDPHHEIERELGRCMSAFANTSGGVIVWGVDAAQDGADKADVARGKSPLRDPAFLKSKLEQITSRVVEPSVRNVRHETIEGGFVATFVPASPTAPHRTVKSPQYYVRAGSSAIPAPHHLLASMFGRRPQPKMDLVVSVERLSNDLTFSTHLKFAVANFSSMVAVRPYLVASVSELPQAPKDSYFNIAEEIDSAFKFERHECLANAIHAVSCVAREGEVSAPGVVRTAINLNLVVPRPTVGALVVEGSVGAFDACPSRFRLSLPEGRIREVDESKSGWVPKERREADLAHLPRRLFTEDTLEGGFYSHHLRQS